MNIFYSPSGIVDYQHPIQGLRDMADAGLKQIFLDIGMYLSFSGRAFMEASEENTRKVIRDMPLDRLLVESNGVFGALTASGQAEHLSHIIDDICTLRGMEKEALTAAIRDNYGRLFS